MSAIKIIQALGRKIAAKKSKTSEGITQIQPQIYAESEASNIAQRLVNAGLPMERFDEFIFSEADVVRLLNQIEALEKKNLADSIRSGIRTIERGKVFDMQGKQIPRGSDIMGGKAVPGTSDRERVRNEMKTKYGFTDKRLNEIENTPVDEKMADDLLRKDDERIIKERLEKQNKDSIQRLKDKMDDPEEKANGGRAGFFMGSKPVKGLATLRQMLNYFGKKSDRVKNPSDILRIVNPKQFNKVLEDPNIYRKFDIEKGIAAPDLIKNVQKQMMMDRKKTIEEMLGAAKNIKKLDDDTLKYKNNIIEDMMKKGVDRKMAEEMAETISDMAKGAAGKFDDTPKLTDEGVLQLENILKDMETGGKKPRELNATGGRIGYKNGPGMNRRTFLKLLGGLASIPIIGKIVKPLKTVKGVKNVPIIKTDSVPGKPEWFDQLVNKVIIEGDDVTKKLATKDREVVHVKKLNDTDEVTVYQDLETDSIRVEYNSPENMLEEPVSLTYTKNIPDEGAPKGSTEFEATEMGFVGKADGPDDFFIDAEEVGGQSIKSLESDVSALKEYATGKGPTMKEFIQNKKRKDKVKKLNEGDLEAQSDYIVNRQGDAYDYDDYASGGIARMLGE